MLDYETWKKEIIWKHLEEYKRITFGDIGNGTRSGREYGHIMPFNRRFDNYMHGRAVDVSNVIKKHPDWYYMSSSQTMCINFFSLLYSGDNYKLLSAFLSCLFDKPISIVFAQFEYIDNAYGDTNFDFYCCDNENHKYFFEVKYTEDGIAKKCSSKDQSEKHLLKVFNEKYKPLIEKDGSFLKKCLKEPMVFMKEHYQAFRNIAVANSVEESYSIFITMKGNEKTLNELKSSLEYVDAKTPYIKSLYWESIVDFVLKNIELDIETKNCFIEFEKKYIPIKTN